MGFQLLPLLFPPHHVDSFNPLRLGVSDHHRAQDRPCVTCTTASRVTTHVHTCKSHVSVTLIPESHATICLTCEFRVFVPRHHQFSLSSATWTVIPETHRLQSENEWCSVLISRSTNTEHLTCSKIVSSDIQGLICVKDLFELTSMKLT